MSFRLFNFSSRGIAIDLGTANSVIYVHGSGIVASEPSVVAMEWQNGVRKVRAVVALPAVHQHEAAEQAARRRAGALARQRREAALVEVEPEGSRGRERERGEGGRGGGEPRRGGHRVRRRHRRNADRRRG